MLLVNSVTKMGIICEFLCFFATKLPVFDSKLRQPVQDKCQPGGGCANHLRTPPICAPCLRMLFRFFGDILTKMDIIRQFSRFFTAKLPVLLQNCVNQSKIIVSRGRVRKSFAHPPVCASSYDFGVYPSLLEPGT